MFSVSGSEANERSMQMARHYWIAKGKPGKYKVISMQGGYHGATAGTFVAAPPEVVHTFRNASGAEAIFLNFHAPSMGFADMLRARRDGHDEDAERFDQADPPPDGGRPVSEAVVSRAVLMPVATLVAIMQNAS
jgi:adenosylmethionine-8-amino-7-oxononanoate aminotransferase